MYKLQFFTFIFYKLLGKLPDQMLREIYYAFIHSHVLYGAEIIRILSLRMAVMHLPTKFCANSYPIRSY